MHQDKAMNTQDAEHKVTAQPKAQVLEMIDEEGNGRQLRGLRWALVVFSVLTSTFLFGFDNINTADVKPAIVRRFGSIDRLERLTSYFWLALRAQRSSGAKDVPACLFASYTRLS